MPKIYFHQQLRQISLFSLLGTLLGRLTVTIQESGVPRRGVSHPRLRQTPGYANARNCTRHATTYMYFEVRLETQTVASWLRLRSANRHQLIVPRIRPSGVFDCSRNHHEIPLEVIALKPTKQRDRKSRRKNNGMDDWNGMEQFFTSERTRIKIGS